MLLLKRLYKAAILSVGLACVGQASTAVGQETKIRFTLDWRIEGPAAPFLLALEKGYFKAQKLNVVIEPGKGSAAAIGLLAQGEFQMGFADVNTLIEQVGNGGAMPVQAVYMVYNTSPAAIFSLKKSGFSDKSFGVAKLADLKGKTVGGPAFDGARKAWPILARAQNLPVDFLLWKSVDPSARESTLIQGQVDAISGFYHTSYLALEERGVNAADIVAFRFADYGVRLYGNAIMVNTKFAEQNPKAVARFLRAFNRALKQTIADPASAVTYVHRWNLGVNEGMEQRRLGIVIENHVLTPETKAQGLGAVDRKRFEASIDDVVAAYGLKSRPDGEALFSSSYLPAAKERAVR